MRHLIFLYTIVISNPFDGIDYNKLNVYTFEKTYREVGIIVHKSDYEIEENPIENYMEYYSADQLKYMPVEELIEIINN